MSLKKAVIIMLALVIGVNVISTTVYAGGDKNTLRGSVGEQIGEPSPDPAQDPDQPRDGDPNEDMENVPPK